MADRPIRHIDEDGSIYAAEIVPPEGSEYGVKYHVDLVRTSVDDDGLGREQRLTVGQHHSWGEAEEHLTEVEGTLEKEGLAVWGEDVQRLSRQPFEETFYMTVIYPPDPPEGDESSAAYLLAIGETGIQRAGLAVGERNKVEQVVNRLDATFAEEGTDRLLEAAQVEAALNGKSSITPLSDPDDGAVRHVDGGGTAHWFAVVERDEPETEAYELRYFRSLEMDDGSQRSDSYPVMPLPDDDSGSAWALPGLEMYLEKGDVYMAQQFAHDVADSYDQDFPDPLELPALDPQPEYYFGYGVGPSNAPALEAVKTWMQGAERRFDTLTLGEYDTFDEAAVDERTLETMMDTQGLKVAMNRAEDMAVAGGYLDPTRGDGRIFFDDEAPPDPFTTHREREMTEPDYAIGAISANGESFLDVKKTWGADEYERLVIPQPDWAVARENAEVAHDLMQNGDLQGAMRLVERAGEEAGVIVPEREDPRLFTQGPPDPFTTLQEAERMPEIQTESMASDFPSIYREFAEEMAQARQANAVLEGTAWFEATFANSPVELLEPLDNTVNYAVIAQDADPWTVELAVEKYWKDPDGYLGIETQTLQTYDTETEREQAHLAQDALLDTYDAHGLEALMHKAEMMAVQNDYLEADRPDSRLFIQGPPDRFETLAQQLENEPNPYWNTDEEQIQDITPQPAVDNPYWRLDVLPVNDPAGEPLGHALHMIVYEGIDHDPEAVGTPAMAENEPFRMLEMAHFETTEAADKFGREFNGYLMPGLLEGPELAEEVALLEGHPVEWKTLEGQELDDYRELNLTLTRDPADWHPYNPHAERDARIEVEGLYSDPIHQFVKLDEDNLKAESVSPDFDL